MATASSHEEHISCPICWIPYRKPQSLKCGHVLCTPCIDQILKTNDDGTVQCSTCRTVSEERDLRRDYKLEETVELIAKLQHSADAPDAAQDSTSLETKDGNGLLCETCEKERFSCKCKECDEYMCETCAETHRRFKVSRNHEYLTMDELRTTLKAPILHALKQFKELKAKSDTIVQEVDKKNCALLQQKQNVFEKLDSMLEKLKCKCDELKNKYSKLSKESEIMGAKTSLMTIEHSIAECVNQLLDLAQHDDIGVIRNREPLAKLSRQLTKLGIELNETEAQASKFTNKNMGLTSTKLFDDFILTFNVDIGSNRNFQTTTSFSARALPVPRNYPDTYHSYDVPPQNRNTGTERGPKLANCTSATDESQSIYESVLVNDLNKSAPNMYTKLHTPNESRSENSPAVSDIQQTSSEHASSAGGHSQLHLKQNWLNDKPIHSSNPPIPQLESEYLTPQPVKPGDSASSDYVKASSYSSHYQNTTVDAISPSLESLINAQGNAPVPDKVQSRPDSNPIDLYSPCEPYEEIGHFSRRVSNSATGSKVTPPPQRRRVSDDATTGVTRQQADHHLSNSSLSSRKEKEGSPKTHKKHKEKKSSAKFRCEICDKGFISYGGLTYHKRQEHQ